MKKTIIFVILTYFTLLLVAQPNINFLDHSRHLKLYGGLVIPGENLKSTDETGFYAKNGSQFGFEFNWVIQNGFGLGADIEFDNFKFNNEVFFENSKAETMKIKKGIESVKYQLNTSFNMPVLLGSDDFVINFYLEGNVGLRTMRIPEIDLTYNEIANKYVEVSYRTRDNLSGFIGYSGGAHIIFMDVFGVNLSYNSVIRSRHNVLYSVRMFDALGELYEDENYINGFLDHTGFQFGLMYFFRKTKK